MVNLPPQLERARNGGIEAIVAEVQRSVLNLSIHHQMQIVRAIAAGDASFSDGVDKLTEGADWIDSDLDDEEEGVRHTGMLTRAQGMAIGDAFLNDTINSIWGKGRP